MNTLVIFEVLLALSALFAVSQLKPSMTISRLFWSMGFFSIGFAAFLGALKYAGIQQVAPYHGYAATFAGSLGLVSLTIGGIIGAMRPQSINLGALWYIIHAAIAAIAALVGGVPTSPTIQYGSVCLLLILGVIKLVKGRRTTGLYMVGGIGCFVAAAVGSEDLASLSGMQALNVYHLLLALAVLLMGLAAARD